MSGRKGSYAHRWSDAERARLAEVAPGRSHAEIRAIMTAEFGDHYGGKRISAALKRYGIRTGLTGRFEKGMVPHNKGKSWDEYGTPEGHERSRATCFKAGEVHGPEGHVKPIGYERVDSKDGYPWVKVKDTPQGNVPGSFNDNFKLTHNVVWEAAHGPIPKSTVIVFADGDKRNFDVGNLVAVPRELWCVICHRHIAYWDAESLQTAMLIAKVDKARYSAQCRPRACRKCGKEFAPRYAHQRTCDGCLKG